MSDAVDDEDVPPQYERLTLQRSRELLRMHATFILFFAAFGVYQLHDRHVWFAVFLFIVAASQALILPALWKQHRMVKQGAVIYLKPAPTKQVPFAVSLFATCMLTLLVAVIGCGSFYFCVTIVKSLSVRLLFGVVNFFLWLVVGLIWHRFLTAGDQQTVLESAHQSLESVWPPPPKAQMIGIDKNSED